MITADQPPSTTFTGGVTSQTVQAINVLAFVGMITSGANFTLSAKYNAAAQGPIGGIAMQFFSGNTYASQIGLPVFGSINVDGTPGTWQTLTISGSIPTATTSMMAQVYYSNASLINAAGITQAGYVDDANLRITAVPEPAGWALLLAGGVLIGWRKRRQAGR